LFTHQQLTVPPGKGFVNTEVEWISRLACSGSNPYKGSHIIVLTDILLY